MKPVRTLTADDVFYRSMSVPGANSDDRDAQLLVLDIEELDNDIIAPRGMDGLPGIVHRKDRLSWMVTLPKSLPRLTTRRSAQSVVSPLWSAASTCDPLEGSENRDASWSVARVDTLPI